MESANLLSMYQEQTDIALFAKYKDQYGNKYIDDDEITDGGNNRVCCVCGDKWYTVGEIWGVLGCGVLAYGLCTGEIVIC